MKPKRYIARPKLFSLVSTKCSDDVIWRSKYVISSTQPPSWIRHLWFLQNLIKPSKLIDSNLIKTNKETHNDIKKYVFFSLKVKKWKFKKPCLSISCNHGNIKSREQYNVIPNCCQTNFRKSHEVWWLLISY